MVRPFTTATRPRVASTFSTLTPTRARSVELDGAKGAPDGLAIDAEDGLWVALWGGGAVHRYDSHGRLSEVVELPVPKVTACTFGGPDGRTLYITTSREGMSAEEFPEAGALFSVRAGVRGAAPYAFSG
jgi:sugar lactone lactonase YvrE